MAVITQPLRDEHQELMPELDVLLEAASGADSADAPGLLDRALRFLQGHLIPHAQAEEAALYPVVGRLMGAPAATSTMTRDHVEVGRLTEQLSALRGSWNGSATNQSEARRLLYGLYALLRVHFAKEEEVYLPLLDERLSAQEGQAMFAAMEKAAAAAKGAAHSHSG
jgi:hemerythrin-like domain-containing protein